MTPQDYEQLFSGFSFNNPYLSDTLAFNSVSGRTQINVITTYPSASTVYMSDYLGYPGDICDPIMDIVGNSEFAGQDQNRIYNLFYIDGEVMKHLESFWFDESNELILSPIIPDLLR